MAELNKDATVSNHSRRSVRLGDICTVVSGSTPSTSVKAYWGGTIKWVTPAEINDRTCWLADTVKHITDEGFTSSHLTMMPAGTVLLSSRAPIGKVAITAAPMCCNQGFKNLICSDQVSNEYLFWHLKAHIKQLQSLGRGATFKEISKSTVENYRIWLPSIDEQRAIASRLFTIDGLMSKLSVLSTFYESLIKSRFIEMFGTISQAQVCWGTRPLKSVVSLLGGYAFKSSEYSTRGTRIIRISNVQNGYIEDKAPVYYSDSDMSGLERYLLRRGDLLMSLTGNVGRVGFLQKELLPAALNQRVVCLREACGCSNNRQVHMRYLYELFRSSDFQRIAESNSSGVAQKNLSTKWLAAFNVPLPPFTLQEEFAALAYRVDKLRFDVQKQIEKLNLLKQSLMQEYFG